MLQMISGTAVVFKKVGPILMQTVWLQIAQMRAQTTRQDSHHQELAAAVNRQHVAESAELQGQLSAQVAEASKPVAHLTSYKSH